jgi:purine-cytosine permease-like protein
LPGVWLEQYTNFMVILGGLLVPIGGVLVAHYYLGATGAADADTAAFYDAAGPFRGANVAGVSAWIAAAAVYFAANRWSGIGGTMPALATSIAVYAVARRS